MSDVAEKIIKGELDSELETIISAIKERRKIVQTAKAFNVITKVKQGDKVRLKGLSPKYLNGNVAEVIKPNQKSVQCFFPETIGKYIKNVPFNVPASCLEIVDGH